MILNHGRIKDALALPRGLGPSGKAGYPVANDEK